MRTRSRRAARGVGELDALVNNAGIAIAAPLEFLPPDELARQLDVNVIGQVRVTQAFLPSLRARNGRIVFVGSIGGRSALPFLGAYAASKFALEAITDSLRIEVAPCGIDVSIVEPGTIATPMWTKPQRAVESLPPEAAQLYGERIEKFRGSPRSAPPARAFRRRRSQRRSSTRSPRSAEDALPRRRRREAACACPTPAGSRARPRAHALPVRARRVADGSVSRRRVRVPRPRRP